MKGQPQVVILDEPTSSLANAEVELVINAVKKMSALGVAVIYVSHRMEEIRRIASCATIMRDGQVAGDVTLERTTTQEIVSLMLGREHIDLPRVKSEIALTTPVLQVARLRHPPKLQQINFTLHRGEVLGIAGLLGSGRSELLKAIIGLETFAEGRSRSMVCAFRVHGIPRCSRVAWAIPRKTVRKRASFRCWAWMKIR
jgi:simple sugar transport system ATP-binding protein